MEQELDSGQLRELCLLAALPRSTVLAAGTQIHWESSLSWAQAQQCCLSPMDFCDQLVPPTPWSLPWLVMARLVSLLTLNMQFPACFSGCSYPH